MSDDPELDVEAPIDGEYQEVPGEVTPGEETDTFTSEGLRLGMLLVHYRRLAHVSQEELSRESGVDESNISLIETGKTQRPQPGTLERLAAALALKIRGSSPERIFDHLMQARDYRPVDYTILPELVLINDRLLAYPRWFILVAADLFSASLEAVEKVYHRLSR